MALAAILVVATVAFGANLLGPIIVPDETPTPVIVGDEPTPPPSDEVTPEPTPVPPVVTPEPTPVPPVVTPSPTPEPTLEPTPAGGLTLTAKLSGTKVVLTWSAYDGADFAYYKLVRSSDAEASWPLGPGDTLLAAISNQSTLTYIDSPPTGKTWSYQVFVVKSTEEGFVVIAATNLVTIAVPKPTPPPTQNCGITLTAAYSATEHAVKLHWTKYNCDLFEAYLPIRSESTSKPDGPLPVNGVDLLKEVTNVNSLSMSDGTVKPGHTYYFRVLVWNSQALCYGGTILARSNIVKIVIPAAAEPTPAAS